METVSEDNVTDLTALLDQVSESTKARTNPWWRCKSCWAKKWKERAPKQIFKHAIRCGFPEKLRTQLRDALMEIKNAQNTSEIPETQDPAAPKSILKKSEDPIYITSQDLNDPDLAPDDLERLEISSKGKRPLLQPDPVFHIPGKSGWTLRTDSTARRRHIRILGDILYVSIQRQDWYRARRTWALLLRVPEVEWTDIWRVGLFLLDKGVDLDERRARENRIDWLKTMMRKVSYHRETILQELLIELIIAKDFQQAEEQALMYMAEYPFLENATLRGLSGLLYLYNAQRVETTSSHVVKDRTDSSSESSGDEKEDRWVNGTNLTPNKGDLSRNPQGTAAAASESGNPAAARPSERLDIRSFEPQRLRAAKHHFRAALRIDKDNTLAHAFLQLLGDDTTHLLDSRSQSSSMRLSESESDAEGEASPLSPLLSPSNFRTRGDSSNMSDGDDERRDKPLQFKAQSPTWPQLQASAPEGASFSKLREIGGRNSVNTTRPLHLQLAELMHADSNGRPLPRSALTRSHLASGSFDSAAELALLALDAPNANRPQPLSGDESDGRGSQPSRDEISSHAPSWNASDNSTLPRRSVRFLDPNSSEDDKGSGRRRKKARR